MRSDAGSRGVPSELHRQIGAHVVAGATDAAIAASVFVSEATVRRRLAELKEYTRTFSRAGLAAEIVRRGWVDAERDSH
jgi:hypothetical protein